MNRCWQWLRTLLRYEPMQLARWEVILMRAGLAYLTWRVMLGDSQYQSQAHPNGVAMFTDLTWLSDNRWEDLLRPASGVCLIAWVIGAPGALALLVPLFFGIGLMTLKNSQGAIGHSYQAVHLCLLGAWLANVAHWLNRWRGRSHRGGLNAGQWEIDWSIQALGAGYVASAISKLVESSGMWFADSQYFALHLIKNNQMKYLEYLEGAPPAIGSLPQWLMDHPLWAQFLFGIALPLELFAFLAPRNRVLALVFGVGLVTFHGLVKALTQLDFVFNESLLILLFINPVYWIVAGMRRLRV